MNNGEMIRSTLKKLTLEQLKNNQKLVGATTEELSVSSGLNRTYVSHQLNLLNNEQKIIKINTRPVYYLDSEEVQRFFHIDLGKKVIYRSHDEFRNKVEKQQQCHINEDAREEVFKGIIGYNGSLAYQLEQCKAAVKYPPNGLSVLITGPTGCGKSMLANKIYDYAKSMCCIKKDAPFIVFNCAQYFNNKELLSASIFGYKKGAFTGADEDREGIIEKADGGFVFLDEIHRLPPEGQELLFFFMDKGLYTRIGENEKYRKSDVRFIFATTEKPDSVLLNTFMRRIPIVIKLSSLNERPLDEKQKLIFSFLKEESGLLGCDLKVSRHVLKVLLDQEFGGNIGQLKNSIKLTCARAFSSYSSGISEDGAIKVDLMSLPDDLMQGAYNKRASYVDRFIGGNMPEDVMIGSKSNANPTGFRYSQQEEDLYKKFCDGLLELLSQMKDKQGNRELLDQFRTAIDDYFSKLVFNLKSFGEEDIRHVRFNLFYKCIQDIFYFLNEKYHVKYYDNTIYGLTCFIQRTAENYYSVYTPDNYEAQIDRGLHYFKKHYAQEYELTYKIVQLMESNLDLSVGKLEIITILLYLIGVKKEDLPQRTKAVILAHGYSTASSIANVANHLLNGNIFESFDMPIDISTEDIIKRIKQYLQEVNISKGIMILVDMGSLEEIYAGLEGDLCDTTGIVNNVTTKLALEVGNGILNGLEVEEIMARVSKLEGYRCKTIVPINKKKQAFIVTCMTGIGTAVKIKELLTKSLGEYAQNIKMIPYGFEKLNTRKTLDQVFHKYEVKAIIGTDNPNITEIPFIYVEDLISSGDKGGFDPILEGIIPKDKTASVKQSILKYFTLESVLSYITILNPDKLIDQLEVAIETLQYELNQKFTDDLKICLYIHLSCLIERLVTKTHAEGADNTKLNTFKVNNSNFINWIKKSFNFIENYYSIKIPISEIYYIYEILNEKAVCLDERMTGSQLERI